MTRKAIVTSTTPLLTVRRYLPSNYTADLLEDGRILITGEDWRGWGLDTYVLPRLASGSIWATEVHNL